MAQNIWQRLPVDIKLLLAIAGLALGLWRCESNRIARLAVLEGEWPAKDTIPDRQ